MKKLTNAAELNAIYAAMHGKPLPKNGRETVANFRFEPNIEQSFLQYYTLQVGRFVALSSLLFLIFLVLDLSSEGVAFTQISFFVLFKTALIGLANLVLVAWILQHVRYRQTHIQHRQPLMPLVTIVPIAANLTVLIHSNHTTLDMMTATVSLFYCVTLVALILRMSLNQNLPLVLPIGGLTIATIWGIGAGATIPIDLHSLVAVIAGVFACAVFEYDLRCDFVGQAHVYRVATTDPLSKTLNRHAFFERGQLEINRARRSNGTLCLVLLDIDRFKQINDRFGHPIGDQVIASISDTCQSSLRSSDLFGRIGGEEFAIFLPDTDLRAAALVAERLRSTLESHKETPAGSIDVTVSIGVAQLNRDETSLQELIGRTDMYLYAAKRAGRNRVVTAPLPESAPPEPLSEREVGHTLNQAGLAT